MTEVGDSSAEGREQLVAETFVELADTLASDYEIGEFLHLLVDRCTRILRADTAGVLLAADQFLRLSAGVSAEMERLERAEAEAGQGLCIDAYRTGEQVIAHDLAACRDRWPQLVDALLEMGMRCGYAFPLSLRGERIGALNIYRRASGCLSDADIRLGQAFADVAAIGILNERKIASAELKAKQLQTALDSRILIEQAKGVVSQRYGVPVRDAFEALRHHARSHRTSLREVCRRVIDEGLEIDVEKG